jgi:hypothetical protein
MVYSRHIVVNGLKGPGIEFGSGEIFHTRPDRPWDLPSLLYNGHWISFAGEKRLGCGADHPPHVAPKLKNEYSYISTSAPCLHGLFWGDITVNTLYKGD